MTVVIILEQTNGKEVEVNGGKSKVRVPVRYATLMMRRFAARETLRQNKYSCVCVYS